MRYRLLMILMLVSLVAARELDVEVMGTPVFSGCNCRLDSTPNPFEIGFSVYNPSPRSMQLSYEWLDLSNNSYRKGEKVMCTIGSASVRPNSHDSCRINLYTMSGGLNGSAKTYVRLIGNDGLEEYTKMFEVSMEYHTSPYESNIVSRMDEVEHSLAQLSLELQKSCYRNLCCGMEEARRQVNNALHELYEANSSLRICGLTSAWNYLMNASNSVRSANDSFLSLSRNCSNALSLINSTSLRVESVANVVSEGRKCGANVTLSESYIQSSNSSLESAKQAVASDNYKLAFSDLSSANSSIFAAVASIGQCPQSKPNETVLPPAGLNSTNQSSDEPHSDSTLLLIAGGAIVFILLLAVFAAAALLLSRKKPSKQLQPSLPPAAPPSVPPKTPPAQEVHEDLEKEFEDWLASTKKK